MTELELDDIELTSEFKSALRELDYGTSHVLVTGRAGTGKSTLLRYFCEHHLEQPVVLAPTGVAALTVEGQTIHSFFRFGPNVTPDSLRQSPGWMSGRRRRLMKKLDTIVIDEVSMLRADLLDCIDVILRKHGPRQGLPFGGVRLVMFGDLYQLPPVVPKDERQFFSGPPWYNSQYFFDAEAFRSGPGDLRSRLKVINLTRIFRQVDGRFVALLNRIREGISDRRDLELLNQRVRPSSDIPKRDYYVVLTGSNKDADSINGARLREVAGRNRIWLSKASITGECKRENERAPRNLRFCVGAQVMMVHNDADRRWVNGSLGIVTDIQGTSSPKQVHVRLKDGPHAVVKRQVWEIFKYQVEMGKILPVRIGTYSQFPFRLCWAITIHKSQSKTFDHMAINLRRAFAYGQTYVALSRCTSLEGIDLFRPLTSHSVFCDPRIGKFLDEVGLKNS
ncbi:MAG: AAA family ATPase [Rhodobacteraceae bacterium]|nr:AAA family ATPase [Paracoccaceae bacterium]